MRIQGPSGPVEHSSGQQQYMTQEGDTLRSIATQFQVDPEALKNLNNLKNSHDDKLQAGVQLLVPEQTRQGGGQEHSGLASVADKISAEGKNPFIDPGSVGANWGDGDPYDPVWWEVEPPWMEAATFGDDQINPDPGTADPGKILDPGKITKKLIDEG